MKFLSILLLSSLLIIVGCSGEDPAAPQITGIDQSVTSSDNQVVKEDFDNIQGEMKRSHGMVPFRGTFTTVVAEAGFIPPSTALLDIWGEGHATHLGKSTWYSLSSVDIVTGEQSGSTVGIAANGDEFHYDYLGGSAVDEETGISSFWGDWTVTGGTGRFSGATGGGTYAGTAVLAQGAGQITFEGEISRPNRNRFVKN